MMGKNNSRSKYVIDVVAFVTFLAAMDPRSTGIPLHEWVSIAFAGAVVVHLLLSWKWINAVTRRFFGKTTGRARLNYLLNTLLFFDDLAGSAAAVWHHHAPQFAMVRAALRDRRYCGCADRPARGAALEVDCEQD